ncbi:hypothetical protein D6779_07190, partial [Candidatus Parcubacteria bacterium]
AALFVGLWALFFNTVADHFEQAPMYLPLPLFCLIALWWVRWWAIRPPGLWVVDILDDAS